MYGIYRKNHFKVNNVNFTFESLFDDSLFARRFVILTAWNPINIKTDNFINAKHNKILEKELQ